MVLISCLRVWVLGAAISAAIAFIPGAPSGTKSNIVVTPSPLVADGVTTAAVQVTLRDAYDNIVPNASLTLMASGGNTTFAAVSGASDANGQYKTTVSSTQVQTQQISAALAGNVTLSTSVQFVAGPPVSSNSSLTVSPATQVANNSSDIVATLTLRDSLMHPVATAGYRHLN
ncbi:MAG: hypothetical protein EOO38_10930 [Cytophagaceae bacterium]|nr:MAG: hypothetical protein EOO38_10930 [Cytophagaceae bacterium]